MNTPESTCDDEITPAQRLAELTKTAQRKGYQLRWMHSGYVLRRGAHSWHFNDLKTASALLSSRKEQTP